MATSDAMRLEAEMKSTQFLQAGEELLTISELAALLKVPKSWIYAHTRPRSKTRLPHVKLGKYLRFSEREVRTFLQRLNRG